MMSKELPTTFEQWRAQSAHRFSDDFLDTRLRKEQRKADVLTRQESGFKHRYLSVRALIPKLLSISGLKSIGHKQACQVRLNHNDLRIANLPSSFHGYKLLHISDPHFNESKELSAKLLEKVQAAEYDYCVLTGDYRYRSFGAIDVALQGVESLQSVVDKPTVAILGNHDSIKMVPPMEALGIRVLVNEQIQIEKNKESIHLVGVDDPSYYKTHNLAAAMGSKLSVESASACTVLLAHSPNIYRQASEAGFNAYLCGHTHGGQICLPGGVPVMKDAVLPRWSIAGDWQYEGMAGYTSVGVGVSIVEARFFCPPEITVHTLLPA